MKLIRYERPQWPANDFDRLFDFGVGDFGRMNELFNRFWGQEERTAPAVDLHEDKEHYYVKAELPGFSREQIDLELENGVLTLSAHTKDGEGENAREYSVSRSLSVPEDADAAKISARHENGVLTITLPKQEERKPRRIAIK